MSVRVLIADDQRLIRQCFERVLASDPEIEVVGCATGGREAVLLCMEHRPDVVLMDLAMEDLDGVEATRLIHERAPGSKVLMLSMHGEEYKVSRAMRAGIEGYVVKDVSAQELVRIVKAVHRDETIESPYLVDRTLRRDRTELLRQISPREVNLLKGLCQGCTNAELAERLFVSEQTVKHDLMQVFEKLGVTNRTEAAIRALELGVVVPVQSTRRSGVIPA
ncbi:MAG: response regulator transcription factor [Proteobacteria bacterium]|nr:response regulator transcription factor [Pseudomonadota bacterium]